MGGQGSRGRNTLKTRALETEEEIESVGGKKDGGPLASGRDIGVRVLQGGRLGAERGSPVDTGRFAHRDPPRGAPGREAAGREPPREAAEAALGGVLIPVPCLGGRSSVWGNSKPKRESKKSSLRWLLPGEGGPLGGQCLPQGEPRERPGAPRPGSERGLGTTAELRGSLAAGGSARSPARREAEGLEPRAEGRGREDRLARRPGPTPTHLRAPSLRHVRKRRLSALRRRAPAPSPPLPGRSRRPGGLASRWLRQSRCGCWRETLGGGAGAPRPRRVCLSLCGMGAG